MTNRIETDRLLLRPPSGADLAPWTEMLADSEASRFIGGPQSPHNAWRNLALFAGSWSILGYGNFSVIEKASGRWIGRAGPWNPVGWPAPEIGWALDRSAWGRGYATEAAMACMDYVFNELSWPRVVHLIVPENAASVRVALRLGSARLGEACLPPPPGATVDLYGQTAEEWRGRSCVTDATPSGGKALAGGDSFRRRLGPPAPAPAPLGDGESIDDPVRRPPVRAACHRSSIRRHATCAGPSASTTTH